MRTHGGGTVSSLTKTCHHISNVFNRDVISSSQHPSLIFSGTRLDTSRATMNDERCTMKERSHLFSSAFSVHLSGTLSEVADRAARFVARRKIIGALRANDGNKTRAAETFGVSYQTLLTKIKDDNL